MLDYGRVWLYRFAESGSRPTAAGPFLDWETTGMSMSAMQPRRVEEYKYGLCVLNIFSGVDMLPQLQEHCKETITRFDRLLF